MTEEDAVEARKKAAERGWLADPPPRPDRSPPPSHAGKWYIMMGARRPPGRR
ncbi:MAG: hypothetical protein ACR2JM_01865 [Mycobacterium sp.]